MNSRGRFITLEGGEGVGKSTQVRSLAESLGERGINLVVTREPGGSAGAEAIRGLLLTGDEERWGPRAEALLFAAARADHVEKTIRPALDAGKWVLCDRFIDSSLAYQSGAGGLAEAEIRSLSLFACDGLLPDRTLVLVNGAGGERAQARDDNGGDRIGARPAAYHQAVEAAFRALADREPDRVRLVDASGSRATVTQRLVTAVGDLLP